MLTVVILFSMYVCYGHSFHSNHSSVYLKTAIVCETVFILFRFILLYFTLLYIYTYTYNINSMCAVQNIITSQSFHWNMLDSTICMRFVYIFIKCSNGNINAVTTAIAAMMTPTMNIQYHTIPYHTYAIDIISKK